MVDALAALEARTPLGAADMPKAIGAVVASFAGESKNARAAVYIGDGRSTAHLIQADEFQTLAAQLADARIPWNSYAVGARIDGQLLGALAVQSGGALIFDTDALKGEEAGRQLAAAAGAAVLWPDSVTWPKEMTEVLPKRLPPLRYDRETVVIGTFKGKGPLSGQIVADGAAGRQTFAFTVSPGVSDDNNHYVAQLVERARLDGGVTLPLLGVASLAAARDELIAGVHDLNRLAQEAMTAGNLDAAEHIVSEALRRDPNDMQAAALQRALAKRRQGGAGIPPPPGKGSATPAAPAPSAPAPGGPSDLNLVGDGPAEPPAGAMAESFEHDRRVMTQIIQAEVQNTLQQARSLMSTDPDTALQQLKLMLEKVRQAADLDPDVRRNSSPCCKRRCGSGSPQGRGRKPGNSGWKRRRRAGNGCWPRTIWSATKKN